MTTEPGPDVPGSTPAPAESTSALQSMLSRAVEGQVDEQRELAGAIDDMRSQLMRLGHDISDLRLRAPREEVSDAQINTVTVELREAVRFLSERLDGVTRMLALRGEEFADVRTVLTALDATLRAQGEAVAEIGEEVSQLPVYDERLSHLQVELGALHAKARESHDLVAAVPTQGAIESAIAEAVISAVAPLTQQLSEISAASAAHAASVAAMQRSIEPVAGDLAAMRASITDLAESGGETDAHEAIQASVQSSVQSEVQASERRLTAHIDEAVLALAEALLRRRISPARGAATVAPDAAEHAVSDGRGAAAPAIEPDPASDVAVDPVAEASAEPDETEPAETEPAETVATEPAPAELAPEAPVVAEPEPQEFAASDGAVAEESAAEEPVADLAESAAAEPEAHVEPEVVAAAAPTANDALAQAAAAAAAAASGDDPDAEFRPAADPVEADGPAVITAPASEMPPYFASADAGAVPEEPEPPAVWWEQEIGTINPMPDADIEPEPGDIGWVATPASDESPAEHSDSAELPSWEDDPYSTTEIPRVDDGATEADHAEPLTPYAPSSRWSPEPPPARDDPEPEHEQPSHEPDAPKRRRRWF